MNSDIKILIVDDEPAILMILEQLLAAEGYNVTCASGGNEAIQCAGQERFDLVMMDLIMPGKDGVETILSLRGSQPDLRIIAMSGASQTYLPLAIKIGASRGLVKPFDRLTLLEAVTSEIAKSKELLR